jgi:hypothetical protein
MRACKRVFFLQVLKRIQNLRCTEDVMGCCRLIGNKLKQVQGQALRSITTLFCPRWAGEGGSGCMFRPQPRPSCYAHSSCFWPFPPFPLSLRGSAILCPMVIWGQGGVGVLVYHLHTGAAAVQGFLSSVSVFRCEMIFLPWFDQPQITVESGTFRSAFPPLRGFLLFLCKGIHRQRLIWSRRWFPK